MGWTERGYLFLVTSSTSSQNLRTERTDGHANHPHTTQARSTRDPLISRRINSSDLRTFCRRFRCFRVPCRASLCCRVRGGSGGGRVGGGGGGAAVWAPARAGFSYSVRTFS